METTSDRKCKEVSLIGAKEDVIQAQKQTEEFVASKIPKPKPPPTNPQKNRSQIDNPVCSRGAGKPGDGTVTVLLRKGDITTFKGDAIINLLPDNLKLGNGGAVCNNILRVGGEMIQQEINKACQLIQHTPGIRFITSAGSSRNVKKIIHFVLSSLDTMGLQNDIKECFFLAQRYSLRSILIPAIGTANFNLSSRASAEIIFNAMSNFSTACTYHLTVIVVVFQEKMLPDFKSVLNESVEKCFSLKPEESNAVKLPTNWTVQAKDIVVQLVKLQQTSSGYIKILSLFRKSDVSGWVVTMIERIQNPGLYRAYIAKKQSMCTRNELKLFHGTDSKNIAAINTQNFSRGFAGENATRYGNGVYFARDSSYSVNYCKSEVGRNLKLYVVKVLIGEYTLGREGMKAPPLRGDRKNPGLQFDSLVNNMTDPSIFVIFQDHQCYPEYLISFKKKVK
ncbi:protein mono-ADP-ribosyltransferase PARP15-like [Dendronephthya gigantea]|uniref:protein mono-ADP-ribosyltransferase PARP15-like n=1 Tax=Dendronephthya gigantea TaxID=151771 RepID=UPI00106C8A67|nr:protein mono-ADP-ribosyltransferase PARP15-like [Dendronephthya gigantea]